jgi:hypothetical protein
MQNTSRNFIVAYIVLVGLPLAGLAGVLRSGRNLAAPISVDGAWKVEADATHLTNLSCASSLGFLANASLLISQSGKSLVVSYAHAKSTNAGSIDGRNLKAELVPLPDSVTAGCGSEKTVILTAIVDPKTEPRSLTGSLSIPGCPSCAPVEFRATRQPRPSGVGGGH